MHGIIGVIRESLGAGMSGLIREIQRDVVDENVSLATVLRKALVAANSIGGESAMAEWLNQELVGYAGLEKPSYRWVRGIAKAHDIYVGNRPINFSSAEAAKLVSTVSFHQGVGSLEALVRENSHGISVQLPDSIASHLIGGDPDVDSIVVLLSAGAVAEVLNTIRQRVLVWTTELEARGILVEDRSFTVTTPTASTQVVNNTYTYGNISQSQIMMHSSGSQVLSLTNELAPLITLFRDIRVNAEKLNIEKDERDGLLVDVDVVLAQAESKKPRAGIVREAKSSIRKTLEGAAGSVLASQWLTQLEPIARMLS